MKFKTFITNGIDTIRAIDWKNRRTQKITLGVGVLLIVFVVLISGNNNTPAEVASPLRTVELVDVAPYAQKESLSTNDGKAREMVARAETGGKVVRTLAAGAQVEAGAIIAELENSAQRAALLQAEGALEASQAGEEKTKNGLRPEQVTIRETSLESAKSGAVTTLLSAYATMDSAINDSADKMFYRVGLNAAPRFTITTKNTDYKYKLEQLRYELDAPLARESTQSTTLTTQSDLIAELATTEAEVRTARIFTDTTLMALTDAIAIDTVSDAQILSYRTMMTSTRASLTNTLSALAAARTSLETATINLKEGVAYSQDTDLAGASAAVKQAQGAYAAALSAYQKTIVRASFPGTILSCSAKVGDIISIGADVCRIKASGAGSYTSYALPLSAVKYTPVGAYVIVLTEQNTTKLIRVETGLVTAGSITVTGLTGTEHIIKDIRGLKEGEEVQIAK